MTTVDAQRGSTEPRPAAPPVDRAEPAPGVLVLRVAGAVRTPLAEAAQRCLGESPRVLILDLSRATGFDGHGAALVVEVRARARARGVPVELVVSTYEVARVLRFTDPDALLGAWPALEPVLTTVCPATDATGERSNDDMRGGSR
ncbi:STAS domain-containing protein [Saccharothrix isguenensis]